MKKTNKKGFTIVELVIVIAVIAILASVLIPVFSNIVDKANVSKDTQVVRNMNTALATDEAINGKAEDFGEVVSILKEDGYIIANLNPTTKGWFYVWKSDVNRILLVDKKYDVQFPTEYKEENPSATWYFAVNSQATANKVKDDNPSVNVLFSLTNVNAIKDLLAQDGANIYMDESVVLNAENRLLFNTDNIEVTVNLGKSQLVSNGTIGQGNDSQYPVDIRKGKVTINGGIIGASGAGVDLDGKQFASPFFSAEGTEVTLNDTEIHGKMVNGVLGAIQMEGKATLNNVKTDIYFYSAKNGEVVLNNCVSTIADSFEGEPAIWVTNTRKVNGQTTYDGESKMTINSGSYSAKPAEGWGTVSMHDGEIVINGGDFSSSGTGRMFAIIGTTYSKITISGGTFDGIPFAELDTVQEWKALCVGNYNVTIENGVVTILK